MWQLLGLLSPYRFIHMLKEYTSRSQLIITVGSLETEYIRNCEIIIFERTAMFLIAFRILESTCVGN